MSRMPETPRQVADRYVDELVVLDPVLATALGVPEGQDAWPDYSPAGVDERAALQRRTLRALDDAEATAGGLDALDELERGCARLLRERLEAQLAVSDAGEPLRQLDTMSSPPQSMRQAFTLMPAATDEDWSNIASRLERLPQALDGYRRTLETGRDRGLVAGPHQVAAVADQPGRRAAARPPLRGGGRAPAGHGAPSAPPRRAGRRGAGRGRRARAQRGGAAAGGAPRAAAPPARGGGHRPWQGCVEGVRPAVDE